MMRATSSTKIIFIIFGCTILLSGLNYFLLRKEIHEDALVTVPVPMSSTNTKSIKSMAELSCKRHGGPTDEIALMEMVYWNDIPTDEQFINPFQMQQLDQNVNDVQEKYLVFENDVAGWNNQRMALETIITLAISMGRTIVLPPEQDIYLLSENKNAKHTFSFRDFFHLNRIEQEHIPNQLVYPLRSSLVKFISMKKFLKLVLEQGLIRDGDNPVYPPSNRTDWDGASAYELSTLWNYLRKHTIMNDRLWNPYDCFSFFPKNVNTTVDYMQTIQAEAKAIARKTDFTDNPVDVDAPVQERLSEHLASRKDICVYDKEMQDSIVLHFEADNKRGTRMLLPFYAFHFYEDWKQSTWTKRFVRDHIRYSDEIMCAAARIVHSLRERARSFDPVGNPQGHFDTMHIRRGDFAQQYKFTLMDSKQLFKESMDYLTLNSTIFIATDESDRSYFESLLEVYDVQFLSDFQHLIPDLNSNYFGLVDQLVASRGRVFVGTYYSTFSAYINRIRGYFSIRDKLEGYESGKIKSYYLYPPDYKESMMHYDAIFQPFWAREFPAGWRDIDKGIE